VLNSNVIVYQLQTPEIVLKVSSLCIRLSLMTRLINFPNESVSVLYTYITHNDVELLKVQKYYRYSKLIPSHRKDRLLLMRNAYKISVGKPERKWALVRPRRRWEDNIKINQREIQ
jgi:hypothetical protein